MAAFAWSVFWIADAILAFLGGGVVYAILAFSAVSLVPLGAFLRGIGHQLSQIFETLIGLLDMEIGQLYKPRQYF